MDKIIESRKKEELKLDKKCKKTCQRLIEKLKFILIYPLSNKRTLISSIDAMIGTWSYKYYFVGQDCIDFISNHNKTDSRIKFNLDNMYHSWVWFLESKIDTKEGIITYVLY
jgi:hypothetical protein